MMTESKSRNRLAMLTAGALMLLASVLYLLFVEDPFPMWLIIGGAGVMFIGVGSAIQSEHSKGTRQ